MRGRFRIRWTMLVAGAAALTAGLAAAQDAAQATATLRTRSLAGQCAQCHGTDGHAPAGTLPGALAGMPAATLIEQMKAFRSGSRPSTVMQQLARGFNDAQVEQLARYFAALPPGGAP